MVMGAMDMAAMVMGAMDMAEMVNPAMAMEVKRMTQARSRRHN